MARDVEADLKVNDKTGAGVDAAARKLDDYSSKVKKTGLDAEKSLAGSMTRLGSRLSKEGATVGSKFAGDFLTGSAQLISKGGPALAVAAGAAAPFLSAVMSGAVVGGAGIGGIVGGAVLASRDARVKAAGERLGENLLGQLERSAAPFVPQMIAAANDVGEAFQTRIGGSLDRIFRASSGYLRPLLSGVLGFADAAADGFADVVEAAGPVIGVLRDDLPRLGRNFADMLRMIAGDGEAGARGLHVAFTLVGHTLQWVGMTLANLNALFEKAVDWGRYLGAGPWLKMIGALDKTSAATDVAADSSMGFMRALEGETRAAQATMQTLEQLRDQNLTAAEAQTRLAQGTRDAARAIRENGRATSNNTEAGAKNNATLQGLARQINATRDATVKQTGSTHAANVAMQGARETFVRLAVQTGRNTAEANRLANQLLGIPKITRVEARFDKKRAQQDVHNFRGALADIPRNINVQVRINAINAAIGPLRSLQSASGYGPDSGYASAVRSPRFAGDAGSGQHRTGGPSSVSVGVETTVLLDGAPVAARARSVARQEIATERWRESVGRR